MEPGNKSSAEAMHEGQPAPPQFENLQGYTVPERTPEAGPVYNPETELSRSKQIETQSAPPVVAPGVLPTVPSPVSADDTAVSPAADGDAPLVAADEDLIEKEWVDKAKKIIADTKDEPYRREQEVKKLQIEYVRKRYGRIIGDPGE